MTSIQSQLQTLANLVSQTQAAASSSATSVSTDPVQVAQLTHNSLVLLQNNRQLNFPLEQVKGKLVEGQQYQANLLQQQAGTKQVDTLLRLFDKQQVKGQPLPLPVTQSVFQQPLQQLFAATLNSQQTVTLTAKLTAVMANSVVIDIQGKQVELTSEKLPPHLKPGQSVQVVLSQGANGQPQITLMQPKLGISLNVSVAPPDASQFNRALGIQNKELVISKQALISFISQQSAPGMKQQLAGLTQLLSQSSDKQVALLTDKQGKISLAPQPVATVKVPQTQLEGLKNLNIPIEQRMTAPQSSNGTTPASQTKSQVTPLPGNTSVQQLLRQLNPQMESPTATIQKLDTILQDPILSTNESLKNLLSQIQKQLKQAIPQGKENDHQLIKHMLTHPSLSMTPANIVTPPASQGFMAGLMSMLQMSLGARLARQQPGQVDNLVQILKTMMGPSKTAPTRKSLTDMQQLDQKHQLLKEIGKAMAGHQANKITNAEQQLQGQDSFYYTLPLGLGQERRDAEILIRREPEKQQENKDKKAMGSHWKLNMKLDLGDMGQLLAKASLKEKTLELDFYASNQHTLEQVMNFVPLLKRRFRELGIDMEKNRCQLGKIPASLQHTSYQLFEARV